MAKAKKTTKVRGVSAKTGRLPVGVANPIDIYVGNRVRSRRAQLGLTQTELGDGVGLTFQQIQKYERGANRVSASRLYQFGNILDVSISYFFEEMPDEIKTRKGAYEVGLYGKGRALEKGSDVDDRAAQGSDPLGVSETIELVRHYYGINSQRVRKRVFELAKSMAKAANV